MSQRSNNKHRLRQGQVCRILNFSSPRLSVLRNEGRLRETGIDKQGRYWSPQTIMTYVEFQERAGRLEDAATYRKMVQQRLREEMYGLEHHAAAGRPAKGDSK